MSVQGNLLDVRLQKDFTLGKRGVWSLFVDGLNLVDDDACDGVGSRLGTADSFDLPTDFVLPRRMMLETKLTF